VHIVDDEHIRQPANCDKQVEHIVAPVSIYPGSHGQELAP
jgi:hypothetical protein